MSLPRHLSFLLLIALTGSLVIPCKALATEADDLSRAINNEVRQAERLMFSGKNEESDALLAAVAEKLAELGDTDPEHRSLKSLQSKYERIRKQVDKKLGKNTAPVQKATTQVVKEKQESTASSSSSSSANRYQEQMLERALKKIIKDVEYELDRAIQSLEPEKYGVKPASAAEKSNEAMGYIDRARDQIAKFIARYPNLAKDNSLVNAYTRIDETIAKIETWKASQLKEEAAAGAVAAQQAAKAATDRATMETDAKVMISLYETYFPLFEKIYGGSVVQGMQMPQIEQALKMLEEAQAAIPAFADELGRLADTYGKTAMDIYNAMHQRGYTLEHGEEIKMEKLLQSMENVKTARVASAETLAEYANALLGAFNGQLTDHRIKRMGEAKQFLLVGQKFDPGNEKIQDMLASIDDQIAEVADKMESLIDNTDWKDHVAGFSGPGDVKSLAESAKRYFEQDRDWGKKPGKDVEILKVSVRGPWKVAETDPFGRVIQWRLPIHVAVTDKSLKARKLARVYDLSIVAREGGPGNAPKAPPFDGYWVGESWMMRLNKF